MNIILCDKCAAITKQIVSLVQTHDGFLSKLIANGDYEFCCDVCEEPFDRDDYRIEEYSSDTPMSRRMVVAESWKILLRGGT